MLVFIADFMLQRCRYFKIKHFFHSVYELVEPLSRFDFHIFFMYFIIDQVIKVLGLPITT